MVRIIHLDIPRAVTACLNLAARIETDRKGRPHSRNHLEALKAQEDYYFHLADEIQALKWINADQVAKLVAANSFLKEFQR